MSDSGYSPEALPYRLLNGHTLPVCVAQNIGPPLRKEYTLTRSFLSIGYPLRVNIMRAFRHENDGKLKGGVVIHMGGYRGLDWLSRAYRTHGPGDHIPPPQPIIIDRVRVAL